MKSNYMRRKIKGGPTMERYVSLRKLLLGVVTILVFNLCIVLQSTVAEEKKGVTEEILEILKSEGTITEEQYNELMKKAKEEREEEPKDFRVYWKEGIRLDSKDKQFKMKIGGRTQIDWNWIGDDQDIKDAFPNFGGHGVEFRRARIYFEGTIYDSTFFKSQFDFAGGDVDFKDVYIGLKKVPVVGQITAGHQKEPFSLNELTSSKYITFMERALPNAFAPGRNTGIKLNNSQLEDRMTWAVGAFENVDDTGDAFADFSDYNVTARVTGLPWYADEGKKLIHLGLSYSHQFRSGNNNPTRYRNRPETHNTSVRLVDTGDISADDADLINPEVALVYGPFSLQGEYFYATLDNDEDFDFSGFYAFASYFLTGESRKYSASKGYFGRVKPKENFHQTKGGWGAWEVGVRYSYLDLEDGGIKGGKESNVTLGLNWYLNPNVRWMFNYIYVDVDDRDSVGRAIDNGNANIFQTRLQIDF
jgi:phosphate-selective porin OprO/OprP